MGINTAVHFPVAGQDVMNRVGEILAPKESWGEWAESVKQKKGTTRSGMRTLIMQQSIRDDDWNGHIQAYTGFAI